jgi:hypothetical protein
MTLSLSHGVYTSDCLRLFPGARMQQTSGHSCMNACLNKDMRMHACLDGSMVEQTAQDPHHKCMHAQGFVESSMYSGDPDIG